MKKQRELVPSNFLRDTKCNGNRFRHSASYTQSSITEECDAEICNHSVSKHIEDVTMQIFEKVGRVVRTTDP